MGLAMVGALLCGYGRAAATATDEVHWGDSLRGEDAPLTYTLMAIGSAAWPLAAVAAVVVGAALGVHALGGWLHALRTKTRKAARAVPTTPVYDHVVCPKCNDKASYRT